jgi:hypothetical protein
MLSRHTRHICVMELCQCGLAGATWHIWNRFVCATATRHRRTYRTSILATIRRFAMPVEEVAVAAVVVAAAVAKTN